MSQEKSELAKLSHKFWRALETFKKKGRNHGKVRTHIVNKKGPKLYTGSEFSRLLNFRMKPLSVNSTYTHKLYDILSIIDPVLESTGFIYNESLEDYYEVEKMKKISFFEAMYGKYWGYSLDHDSSKLHKELYVHIFKVKIVSIDEVICVTQKATMKGKKISIIKENRISMEIGNDSRKIYLIVSIGNTTAEDLPRMPTFKFAYIDSGRHYVRCGLAMLERADDDDTFGEFVPKTVPLSEITAKKTTYPRDLGFLNNSQLHLI